MPENIIHANENGEFLLSDGSYGNPGCDDCGERDAVVRVNGKYLCTTTDYYKTGNVADIAVDDPASGVSYHFWTNGTAVGYEVHFPDNRIEFFYLNPSDGSDDGVPTVFVYQGTEADPNADTPLCHFVVTPDDDDTITDERDRVVSAVTSADTRYSTCRNCQRPIFEDSAVWYDLPTDGDVCGWDGENSPHVPTQVFDVCGRTS